VLVILLLIATVISAALWLFERDSALPYEAISILAVVLLNAVMGYVQQARAEQAVTALRQMSAAHATVICDGVRQSIAATEVVPGDVILIEEGDTIPADARLSHSTALQTAEAALTGESLPVAKLVEVIAGEVSFGDRQNMIFSGTAATYGRGKAVVTATGMQTQTGRIAGMLKEAPEETTPLQKEKCQNSEAIWHCTPSHYSLVRLAVWIKGKKPCCVHSVGPPRPQNKRNAQRWGIGSSVASPVGAAARVHRVA
jgi:Ca2+-transporting ATPase